MKVTDKIKLLDDVLFNDYDIEGDAAELQATNPEKFRIIISKLLESENITEEEFYRLNEEIDIDDKIDVICRYQLMPRFSLEREIFGMDIDQETVMELSDDYKEIEIYPEDFSEYYDVDENKLDAIYKLSTAYLTTCDNTCLFEVLRTIASNPELINYIPRSHAQMLGIDSLIASMSEEREDNQEIIDILEAIPTSYLVYCELYGLNANDIEHTKVKLSHAIDQHIEDTVHMFPKR